MFAFKEHGGIQENAHGFEEAVAALLIEQFQDLLKGSMLLRLGHRGNPPSGMLIVPVRIAPWPFIRPPAPRIYRNDDALLPGNLLCRLIHRRVVCICCQDEAGSW